MINVTVPDWSEGSFDVMRLGLALAVLMSITKLQFFRPRDRVSYPIGLARIFDLNWMRSAKVFGALQSSVFAATLLYASNTFTICALVFLSIVFVLELTFRSSFGAVNHGFHIIAIVLLAQTVAIIAWDLTARFDWDASPLLASSRDASAAWWTVQAVVAIYFTSGVQKLTATSGTWIASSPHLLVAVQQRADTERQMGAQRFGAVKRSQAMAAFLGRRAILTQSVFAAGLLVQLASPVALFGDVAIVAIGVGLIAFHIGTALLLTARFPEFQLVVLAYFVVPPLVP